MGRHSVLSPEQWADVDQRLLAKESARSIARVYGCSEATIRNRKDSRVEKIESVVNQIVATERAIKSLPFDARQVAHNLAARILSIQDNILSAASYGAASAHRLNAMANSEVEKIDDADPLTSVDRLKGAMALTRAANDASTIAVNLLSANKDRVLKVSEDAEAQGDNHLVLAKGLAPADKAALAASLAKIGISVESR